MVGRRPVAFLEKDSDGLRGMWLIGDSVSQYIDPMKTPILLTLTRGAKVTYDQQGNPTNLFAEESIVVHPNDVEEFGQLFIKGRKGSRLVAQVKGEIWEAIRGNNTEFFERFDKVKKGFWWPRSAYEGVKPFTPENRVITWEAAWK